MAFASRTYTPGSSTTTFALTTSGGDPIGYIRQSDISVTVNGSVQAASSYSFSGTSTVEQPNGGNIVLNAGVTGTVTLTRVTSIQNATVTYTAGSTLTAADLNNADNQIRFGLQEFSDTFAALNTGTGDLEALGGFIGSNEAWASNNTKAATTGAIDARVDSKIDTALTTDVSGGDGVTIVDNNPGSGQIRVDLDADIATLRNMQSGAASALAALTSTELQVLDGATLTTTELNYVDGVTSAIQTQLDNKQPIDSELTTLATMASGTANALKDLTQAEVEILDGATVTTAELNVLDGIPAGLTATELGYVDGVTSAIQTQIDGKQPLDAELTELATMSSGTASALADLTQTEVQILDGVTATTAEINYVDGVTSNVQTQLNAKQPLAAPLTTMSSMQSGTASVLASGTALSATTTELNQLDGKTLGETTLTTNSNTAIPTSKAVADHVAGAVTAVGGFIAIANEVAFPNSQPAANVIVSVSDAGGLSINSSGVVSGATTVGGTSVTITGVPAALYGGAAGNANPNVLAAGEGLQLTSSGSNHSYAYHKILATETDVAQLSGQINDFNERYRYGAQNPTTGLHAGDLFFNTGTGKMLVYDTTGTPGWEEVQSIGNFFISSFTESFDGSRIDFTLSNAPSSAQQVILSINGVIQKPNSGTARPSEGFSLNGATVQLPTGSGPANGTDYFVIVMGSTVNIGTPSNNTVTEAILQNGSVTNDKVSANAAIAGSKISPNFGSQAVTGGHSTFQNLTALGLTLSHTNAAINFTDSNNNPDYSVIVDGGVFDLNSVTPAANIIKINTDGHIDVSTNVDFAAGIDVTGATTLTRSNDNATTLVVTNNGTTGGHGLQISSGGTGGGSRLLDIESHNQATAKTRFQVTADGHVIIPTDSPSSNEGRLQIGVSQDFQVYHNATNTYLDNKTGHLYIRNHETNSNSIYATLKEGQEFGVFKNGTSEWLFKGAAGGSFEAWHDGTKKFETTSYGALVSGNIQSNTIYPSANNSYDLGTSSTRWANIFTNDLNLSNEGSSNDVDGTWGSYTIQEGAEDLFLINRRNGKKYKFNLTEVS